MDSQLSRRDFLDRCLAASTGVGFLGALLPLTSYFLDPKSGASESGLSFPMEELPPGEHRVLAVQGKPVLLFRDGSEVLALSAVCTHLGCVVKWDAASSAIRCPCHGARFDAGGQPLSGPAKLPLARIPASIREKRVVLGG